MDLRMKTIAEREIFGVAALLTIMIAASPTLFLPTAVFLGSLSAIVLYRISNSIEKGFNEHTKALQAIYDEISRANRPGKP
jgi:hypothetical protein